MNSVEKHFDAIASRYDYFKKKNWYYYKKLKELYQGIIPPEKNVLEIGCGTGDILASLKVRSGVGIDISSGMIAIAKQKYPDLQFEATGLENFKSNIRFDYIILADVIEHVDNLSEMIKSLSLICDKNAKVIISYANPLWEPVLLFLEKIGQKMPEGPHYRIPYRKFKKTIEKNNFLTIERNWRLLIPANIPLISALLNSVFFYVPLFKRVGMLEYIIIRKK
jgi:2-polyprenyl-3-methyl-5-hydroxy-6-metoxy-1,4-benzoquinol methylase